MYFTKSSTCGEENMDCMIKNQYYVDLLFLQAAAVFFFFLRANKNELGNFMLFLDTAMLSVSSKYQDSNQDKSFDESW